jgi:Circadian oscillating protein COP23
MQLRLFAQILPGVATAFGTLVVGAIATVTTSNQPSYAGDNKFFCTKEGGVPVTKVSTSRGNETFIRWVVRDFKKFPPLERCQIVSARFQRYYDNGALFITSRDNFQGYPVLCIANRKGTPCTSENILVTLKPGSDTGATLKQIIDFRRGVAASPINLSGCQAITYDDGDLYLDVKQLVESDGCGNNTQSTTTPNTPKKEPVEPRF